MEHIILLVSGRYIYIHFKKSLIFTEVSCLGISAEFRFILYKIENTSF